MCQGSTIVKNISIDTYTKDVIDEEERHAYYCELFDYVIDGECYNLRPLKEINYISEQWELN